MWKVASAIRFATDHPAYGWLNEVLALYEGEFDERTGGATWRVLAAPAEVATRAVA
jgi:hypothetical protein